MVNSEEQQSMSDRRIDEVEDPVDQLSGENSTSTADFSFSGVRTSSRMRSSSSISGGAVLTERLTDFLVDGGDGDLLLSRNDREDNNLLQWLRALDVHVMGACRVDERLKPLLKLNVSNGVAEDLLLAHLSQHFEPSEVGMLARCLCIPLVSIRVGRINKQGTFLCPTAIRGNLNLSLLPTSELRISFIGDDGSAERLATLSNDAPCFRVEIEELIADTSGRSFSIKVPDDEIYYFWCSEKSKLLGMELLRKMKDLLERRPSLGELTGISESRLESFAIHLRAYLLGSTMTPCLNSSVESSKFNSQSSAVTLKPSRFRHNGSQGAKNGPSYHGSLSPRSSSFKEGLQRNVCSLKSVSRDKLRRRGDSYISGIDCQNLGSPSNPDAPGSNCSENELHEATRNTMFPSSSFIESMGKSVIEPSTLKPAAQVPLVGSSLFSPYYCWCPPVASTLQFTAGGTPFSTSSELPSLPSSLLSVTRSASILVSKPPLNVSEVPSLDLPPLLPESLVRFPLSLPTSQQIPTFTPLMCDPIVHIPVIDVCSSGQGYLVSAGPAISTAIPPLHPNLVSPLIPESDSMVEKGARETLRMLISSSSHQPSPPLIDVLPSILSNCDDKQSILAAGSRGLYLGTRDIDATASSVAAIGLISSSDNFVGYTALGWCSSRENFVGNREKSDGSSSVDDFPNIDEERTD